MQQVGHNPIQMNQAGSINIGVASNKNAKISKNLSRQNEKIKKILVNIPSSGLNIDNAKRIRHIISYVEKNTLLLDENDLTSADTNCMQSVIATIKIYEKNFPKINNASMEIQEIGKSIKEKFKNIQQEIETKLISNEVFVLMVKNLVNEAKNHGLIQSLGYWKGKNSNDNIKLTQLMNELSSTINPIYTVIEILKLINKGIFKNIKSTIDTQKLKIVYKDVIKVQHVLLEKAHKLETTFKKLIDLKLKELRKTLGQFWGSYSEENKIIDKFLTHSSDYKKDPVTIATKTLKVLEKGFVQLKLAKWNDVKNPNKGIGLINGGEAYQDKYDSSVKALEEFSKASNIPFITMKKIKNFEKEIDEFGNKSVEEFDTLLDKFTLLKKRPGIDKKAMQKVEEKLEVLKIKVKQTKLEIKELEAEIRNYTQQHMDSRYLVRRKALSKIEEQIKALYTKPGHNNKMLEQAILEEKKILNTLKELEEEPTRKNLVAGYQELIEEARAQKLTKSLGYWYGENSTDNKKLNELIKDLPKKEVSSVTLELRKLLEKGIVQLKLAYYEKDKDKDFICFLDENSDLAVAYEKVLNMDFWLNNQKKMNHLEKAIKTYQIERSNSSLASNQESLNEIKNSIDSLRKSRSYDNLKLSLIEEKLIKEQEILNQLKIKNALSLKIQSEKEAIFSKENLVKNLENYLNESKKLGLEKGLNLKDKEILDNLFENLDASKNLNIDIAKITTLIKSGLINVKKNVDVDDPSELDLSLLKLRSIFNRFINLYEESLLNEKIQQLKEMDSHFLIKEKFVKEIRGSIFVLRGKKFDSLKLQAAEQTLEMEEKNIERIRQRETISSNTNLIEAVKQLIEEAKEKGLKKYLGVSSKEYKELNQLVINLSKQKNLLVDVSKILEYLQVGLSREKKMINKLNAYDSVINIYDKIHKKTEALQKALHTFVKAAQTKGIYKKSLWGGDSEEAQNLNRLLEKELINEKYPDKIALKIFYQVEKRLVECHLANWRDEEKLDIVCTSSSGLVEVYEGTVKVYNDFKDVVK